MSTRRWTVLVGAASLGGLIAAAALLRNADSGGDWSNALSGVGTIAATVVALGIAVHELLDRRRERSAADIAQARLIQVVVSGPQLMHRVGDPVFIIEVENFSATTILDVIPIRATYHGDSGPIQLDFQHSVRCAWVRPSGVHTGGPATFYARTDSDEHQAMWEFTRTGVNGDPEFSIGPEPVEAVVSFMDASGATWERSNKGALQRKRT